MKTSQPKTQEHLNPESIIVVAHNAITVSEVCKSLRRYNNCTGIIKQKIKSLASEIDTFPFPAIIEAIKETLYYKEIGEITQDSLKAISPNQMLPIHHLFSCFYRTQENCAS